MRVPDWRLLRDEPTGGAANMARDEALLRSASSGAPPTLRLYAWRQPTLSLGAHQPSADVDRAACRRLGVDLVRRPTGGGAVLHDHEVTYAVTGRLGEAPFPSSVIGIYQLIASALIAGLNMLSIRAEAGGVVRAIRAPANCFARSSSREILVLGRKLIGSAQVRRGKAFLQHGSILLGFDAARLAQVLSGTAGPEGVPGAPGAPALLEKRRSDLAVLSSQPVGTSRDRGRSAVVPEQDSALSPATLGQLLGDIGPGAVEEAMVRGFCEALCVRIDPGRIDPAEAEDAAYLRAFKYLDAQWTLRGKLRAFDRLR